MGSVLRGVNRAEAACMESQPASYLDIGLVARDPCETIIHAPPFAFTPDA